MAYKLRDGLKEEGVNFISESNSNQIFPVVSNSLLKELQKKYSFEIWAKPDEEHTVIRFVTSWATHEQDVDALIKDIQELLEKD